jgi:hypothetical protein
MEAWTVGDVVGAFNGFATCEDSHLMSKQLIQYAKTTVIVVSTFIFYSNPQPEPDLANC